MWSSPSTNEWSAAIHIGVPAKDEFPDSQQSFSTFHFAWQLILIHAKRSICHSNVKQKQQRSYVASGFIVSLKER
jgi:hypothetical protein